MQKQPIQIFSSSNEILNLIPTLEGESAKLRKPNETLTASQANSYEFERAAFSKIWLGSAFDSILAGYRGFVVSTAKVVLEEINQPETEEASGTSGIRGVARSMNELIRSSPTAKVHEMAKIALEIIWSNFYEVSGVSTLLEGWCRRTLDCDTSTYMLADILIASGIDESRLSVVSLDRHLVLKIDDIYYETRSGHSREAFSKYSKDFQKHFGGISDDLDFSKSLTIYNHDQFVSVYVDDSYADEHLLSSVRAKNTHRIARSLNINAFPAKYQRIASQNIENFYAEQQQQLAEQKLAAQRLAEQKLAAQRLAEQTRQEESRAKVAYQKKIESKAEPLWQKILEKREEINQIESGLLTSERQGKIDDRLLDLHNKRVNAHSDGHNWGSNEYRENDYPNALALFNQAIDADPTYSFSFTMRAKVKLAMGDKEGADIDNELARRVKNSKWHDE